MFTLLTHLCQAAHGERSPGKHGMETFPSSGLRTNGRWMERETLPHLPERIGYCASLKSPLESGIEVGPPETLKQAVDG